MLREPDCNHPPTQRISSHLDLVAAAATDEPTASVYCCNRPKCVQEATYWVQALSAKPAIKVRFETAPQT